MKSHRLSEKNFRDDNIAYLGSLRMKYLDLSRVRLMFYYHMYHLNHITVESCFLN